MVVFVMRYVSLYLIISQDLAVQSMNALLSDCTIKGVRDEKNPEVTGVSCCFLCYGLAVFLIRFAAWTGTPANPRFGYLCRK